jgi:hypothetical protein
MYLEKISLDLEVKSQKLHGKSRFQKQEKCFYHQIGHALRKKQVKCYIWSIAFYGAETWTLLKVDQKYPDIRSFGPIV